MEKLEQDWELIENMFKDKFGTDNLESILYIIGIQELGEISDFTKTQKIEILHIAVCKLLSFFGFYELEKIDEDNWPHYKIIKPFPEDENEEFLLKKAVILYLKD